MSSVYSHFDYSVFIILASGERWSQGAFQSHNSRGRALSSCEEGGMDVGRKERQGWMETRQKDTGAELIKISMTRVETVQQQST